MPMVPLKAIVDGKVNFVAVAWACRLNQKPSMCSIALPHHHTNKGALTIKIVNGVKQGFIPVTIVLN